MTERLRRAAQITENVLAHFEADDGEFASNLRADICGAMAYAEQAARNDERKHRDRLTAELLALEAEADEIEAALRLARGYVEMSAEKCKGTTVFKPANDLATIDAVLSSAQRRIRGQAEAAAE